MSQYYDEYESRRNMEGNIQYNRFDESFEYEINNDIFKPCNQEFNWNELMKLNPEYMRRTNNLQSLEPYVDNMLHSQFNPNDTKELPVQNVTQLISLLQTSAEFLTFTQSKLEEENEILKSKMEDFNIMKKKKEKYDKTIEDIKRSNKEKNDLLKTYQYIIKNGESYNSNNQPKKINKKNNNNINDTYDDNLIDSEDDFEEEYKIDYSCQFCGIKYENQSKLNGHLKRAHLIEVNIYDNNENIYEETFDDKIDDLKNHLENLINSNEMNKIYNILNNKIEHLDNLISSRKNFQNLKDSNQNYNEPIIIKNIPPTKLKSTKKKLKHEHEEKKIIEEEDYEENLKKLAALKEKYKNKRKLLDSQVFDLQNSISLTKSTISQNSMKKSSLKSSQNKEEKKKNLSKSYNIGGGFNQLKKSSIVTGKNSMSPNMSVIKEEEEPGLNYIPSNENNNNNNNKNKNQNSILSDNILISDNINMNDEKKEKVKVNQSINQSINPSINQSIYQSINQSINQSSLNNKKKSKDIIKDKLENFYNKFSERDNNIYDNFEDYGNPIINDRDYQFSNNSIQQEKDEIINGKLKQIQNDLNKNNLQEKSFDTLNNCISQTINIKKKCDSNIYYSLYNERINKFINLENIISSIEEILEK
jgi:hypothetical protein